MDKSVIYSKVPEVTIFFWIIKVLCTTVGETAADFLNTNLNLGLTGPTVIVGILLIVMLFFQFRARKYIPGIYWLVVVLLSVFGTLITDNLTDNLGVSLITTTIVFSVILALAIPAAYYRNSYSHAKRLRVVTAGKFYRSGQMTADGFRDAVRRFDLKTVINLQEEEEFKDPFMPVALAPWLATIQVVLPSVGATACASGTVTRIPSRLS